MPGHHQCHILVTSLKYSDKEERKGNEIMARTIVTIHLRCKDWEDVEDEEKKEQREKKQKGGEGIPLKTKKKLS